MNNPFVSWVGTIYHGLYWFVKKPRMVDYLKSCFSGIIFVYNQFIEHRAQTLFKLRYTGQVIYLEHMLNSLFNNGLPAYTAGVPTGIYIGNGNSSYIAPFIFKKSENIQKYIWQKSETIPTPPGKMWLYTKAQIAAMNVDYIIYVPYSVSNVTDPIFIAKLKAWVNYYNQAGKSYQVINYTP